MDYSDYSDNNVALPNPEACPTCGCLPGETVRRLPPGFRANTSDEWIDCPDRWYSPSYDEFAQDDAFLDSLM